MTLYGAACLIAAGYFTCLVAVYVRHAIRQRRAEAELPDLEVDIEVDTAPFTAAMNRAAASSGYQLGGWVTAGQLSINPSFHFATGANTTPIMLNPGEKVHTKPKPLEKATATEVIVGYRVWPLKRSFPEGYRLTAVNTHFDGTVTPYEKLTAECKKNVYDGSNIYVMMGMSMPTKDQPKTHKAPDPDCACGVYAYKCSVPVEHSDTPFVVGEVNLWGRVIEHEDGYRAQFAYPRRLYVVDGGTEGQRIANALTLAYGVPCEVWSP